MALESLRSTFLGDSENTEPPIYGASKFAQLLAAHYWRRRLKDQATVVAVSPGMIPDTRLSRHMRVRPFDSNNPDAKDVPTGKYSPRST